jgi:adenine phosphoribosyltransferase
MDGYSEDFLKSKITDLPDYPEKGVVGKDITTLLKDRKAFALCIEGLADHFRDRGIDYVVGIEALGFIIGAALAEELGCGFVPIRKKGKLPRKTVSKKYVLGHGTETLEIHEDAIEPGGRALIADDLIATGGTARAAADLLKRIGANVIGFAFLVELTEFKGVEKLGPGEIFSLIKY